MKTTQHTPTPWTYHSGMVWKDGPNVYPKGSEDGIPIAEMNRDTEYTKPTERDANAQFIVTACNAHYELLEACKALTHYLEADADDEQEREDHAQAMAAIARALGKE